MEIKTRCLCPNKGHDEETIFLRDKLDFHQATTITKAIGFIETEDPDTRPAEVLATLSEFYVLMGIERWTILDERRKPLPVSHSAIRAHVLSDFEVASAVVEEADELYKQQILLPLLRKAASSSRPSPTGEKTSPKQRGERQKRPRPLKQSSISTTQTVDTGTTSSSLGGVSSFSPSSESAA